MRSKKQLRAAVEKGFNILEQKNPGCTERIVCEDLDLESLSRCVLGQVYESYSYGCYSLGISDKSAPRYGFSLTDHEADSEIEFDQWNMLKQTWVEYLAAKGIGGCSE